MRGRVVVAAVLASAAFAALAASGCGADCSTQTPPIVSVPTCSGMAAGATVTVNVKVCPRCDQETPTCSVDLSEVSSGIIRLEPRSQVCNPRSSCPTVNPSSCPATGVDCTFTAPPPDNYSILVVDENGQPTQQPFIVSGSATTCG